VLARANARSYLVGMIGRRTGADIFVGTARINELHRKVGAIVTSLGGVEETLRFLDWNLMAFDLAAHMPAGTPADDIVRALQPIKATYFAKHKVLSRILEGVTKGFGKTSVQNALGNGAGAIFAQWQSHEAVAKDLGNRRNAVAHAVVGLTGASPVRGYGFTTPSQPFQSGDDDRLLTEIGSFGQALLMFVQEVQAKLPFRDNVSVHTATATLRL